MLGKEHLVFAYMLLAPLLIILYLEGKLVAFYSILVGIFVGALLPDVDEENTWIFNLVYKADKELRKTEEVRRDLLRKLRRTKSRKRKEELERQLEKLETQIGFLQLTYYFLYIVRVYALFIRKVLLPLLYIPFKDLKGHRMLTHTLAFQVFLLIVNYPVFYMIFSLLWPNYAHSAALYLSLGIFLASITHIIGDSLTKMGTVPLYPLKVRFYGKYITGKNSAVPAIIVSVVPFATFYGAYWILGNTSIAFLPYLLSLILMLKIEVKAERFTMYPF